MADLPEPQDEELRQLLGPGSRQWLLYALLHRRQPNPPTETELRFYLETVGADAGDLPQLLTLLTDHFDISHVRDKAGDVRYQLADWQATEPSSREGKISLRLRAEVLAPQRCTQCGRRPVPHGVVLVVARRIPLLWGGSNERENLEPLCEDCTEGRQQYFAKWDHCADRIREAANQDEPQVRLGELLKAFEGEWVRSDLLQAVASAKEYQDDWQRRLRDLRFLGWDYQYQNRRDEGARTWSYYRLRRSCRWPDNIHAAIKAEETRRRQKRSDRQ